MFAGQQPPSRGRRNTSFAVSVAIHLAAGLIWCWRPAPVIVKPSLTAHGNQGTTPIIYFAPAASQQMLVAEQAKPRPARLYLPVPVKPQYNSRITDQPNTTAQNADTDSSSAMPGSSHGSDPGSFATGADVRPAIETSLVDPPVARSEIPSGVEGDVIVEVTIDDHGNVIATRLLKGLGYGIDEKVVATIRNNWHYRPATRDGVPIPSKYDARFHYRG
jgi:TonB family protein